MKVHACAALMLINGMRRVGAAGGMGAEDITMFATRFASVPAWLTERAKIGVLINHTFHPVLWWIGQEVENKT